MRTAGRRPVRDDDEEVRLRRHRAEQLGEAQVVADQRAHAHAVDVDGDWGMARRVVQVFPGVGEAALLRVRRHEVPFGVEHRGHVREAFLAPHREAGHDPDVVRGGHGTQACDRRSAQGLRPLLRLHREAGRAHFRKDHQSSARRCRTLHAYRRPLERRLRLVPAGVVLGQGHAQCGVGHQRGDHVRAAPRAA